MPRNKVPKDRVPDLIAAIQLRLEQGISQRASLAQALAELGLQDTLNVTSSTAYRWCTIAKGKQPETPYMRKALASIASGNSPFDEIKTAEQQIRAALTKLEVERQFHHDKVIAIDNLMAEYKRLA